jgi:hypothetical protein
VSPLVTPKLEFQRVSGSQGQILGEVLACSAIRLRKSCHFFGNVFVRARGSHSGEHGIELGHGQ